MVIGLGTRQYKQNYDIRERAMAGQQEHNRRRILIMRRLKSLGAQAIDTSWLASPQVGDGSSVNMCVMYIGYSWKREERESVCGLFKNQEGVSWEVPASPANEFSFSFFLFLKKDPAESYRGSISVTGYPHASSLFSSCV